MIKVFKYTNKQGVSSVKVLAVTAESATHMAGISLGSIMFKGNHDLKQVLRDYIGYKVSDHMPTGPAKRNAAGELEGFSKYNDSYKMFLKGSMDGIAVFACKASTIDYVAKLIEPIKNLDKTEEQKASPAIQESAGSDSMFDYYDAANARVFSKWADAELSSDDYLLAFSTGFKHEEMPFVREDFETEKDFEYAESAHNLGEKASQFDCWDEFADYLEDENK